VALRLAPLFFVLILLNLMPPTTMAQTPAASDEALHVPLRQYVKAHETGNGDFIRMAFSADAKVIGHMPNAAGEQLISWSVQDYAQRFAGKPADDEARRTRRFEVLEATADAAVAKVVLDYPSVRFVDFMSLLKINSEWKIVCKVFHAQLKPAPPNSAASR
jgi:Putative lumazine-binding